MSGSRITKQQSLPKEGQYLYTFNHTEDEGALCKMELKYLFNTVCEGKYFFSKDYVNTSRSPFIKNCIHILYTGAALKDIIDQIVFNKLQAQKYKVIYINAVQETVGFNERRKIDYEVGMSIIGIAEMTDPEITFGITKVDNEWIFGECESNNRDWLLHDYKPFSYSNALKVNVSRALVNIAVGNNLNCKVVDPCCGVGTVLIEALSMGIDIKGYEINPNIGANAKENLQYFEYEDVITICDMSTITDKFDVAIVDLPYGVFTKTTPEEQLSIIANTRKIANRLVLIAFNNMDEQVVSSGFTIEDKFIISKGKFKRLVSICR